jgi:hypothetical protein
MKKQFISHIIILGAILFFSSKLVAESQIRFISENDAYGGFSDRYYTNGARLEFGTDAGEYNLTRYLFGGWNGLFVSESEETKYIMGLSIGQEFYTPTNISKADVSFGDRPYSSRVYAGNSLTTWTENSSITTELELGMIGPSVGGGSAQKKFHNYIGSPIPQGWDTQIPDSYSGAIRTDLRKFHHRFFGTHYNLNLGNVNTDISFGLIFRLGNVDRTPGPGSTVLQPGPPILKEGNKGYWYFYVNPGGSFQVYNATIEGAMGSKSTFKNSQRDSAFSDMDSFISNPTPEAGVREYLLKSLIEDNGKNKLDRFILFNQYMVQGTNNPHSLGINYLLFNNIFNGAEATEQGLRYILLKSVLEEWDSLSDNAKLIAVYSLFRPQGGKIPPFIKYYSYEQLSQYILDPAQRIIFLELLRQNIEFTQDKTYVADLKRAVGFIRAGFVSVSDGGFLFSVNYNYTTIDFQSAKGLPQYHQWVGFQLGKVF